MKPSSIAIAIALACSPAAATAQRYYARSVVQPREAGTAAVAAVPQWTGSACGTPSAGYAPSSTAGAVFIADLYYPSDAAFFSNASILCNSKLGGAPGVCFLTAYASSSTSKLRSLYYSKATTTIVPSTEKNAAAVNCNP